MQTILGAGGAIGVELARSLKSYTDKIRLVSRNPKKINEEDELVSADLLNESELEKAVIGSDVVYVTVGFPYKLKVWQNSWPRFIKNVINVCKVEKIRLVFFDNIYMYDAEHLNGMTEDTPINPPSKKGKVREEISRLITNEFNKGELKALIARSADFYGPSIKNTSVLTETVFNNLNNGKKANWFSSLNFKHSFTYTPDAGKATAILGNTDSAYDQVWHLPTSGNPLTGKEWIDSIAGELGIEPRYQVVPNFLAKTMGIFIPIMKELAEMIYQYDRDYVFKSDKFENTFNFTTTPYQTGIKEIVEKDYK